MYTLPFQRIQIKVKQSFHFGGGGGDNSKGNRVGKTQ